MHRDGRNQIHNHEIKGKQHILLWLQNTAVPAPCMCSLMTAGILEQVKYIMPCNHLSYMCAVISRNTGDVLIIQTNELYTLKCVSPFKTCM